MGRNFVEAGFDLTVADYVTPRSLSVYRAELPDCFVVHLRISLQGARARAATRRIYLTDEEFDQLHEMIALPPEVDLVLDVDGLAQHEQLGALRTLWHKASTSAL